MLPRIIGRPADAEQLIIRAGQCAEEVQRAAAAASPSRTPPPAASAAAPSECPPPPAAEPARCLQQRLALLRTAQYQWAAQQQRASALQRPLHSRSPKGLGVAAGVATGGVAALAGGAAYGLYRGTMVAIRQQRGRGLELRSASARSSLECSSPWCRT